MFHKPVVPSPDSSHPDRQAGSTTTVPFTSPLSAKYTWPEPVGCAVPLPAPAGLADAGVEELGVNEAAMDELALDGLGVDGLSTGWLWVGEVVAAVFPRVDEALEQPATTARPMTNVRISRTVRTGDIGFTNLNEG
jgi:hypothetical protein